MNCIPLSIEVDTELFARVCESLGFQPATENPTYISTSLTKLLISMNRIKPRAACGVFKSTIVSVTAGDTEVASSLALSRDSYP